MSPLDRKSIQKKMMKLQDIIGDLREYAGEANVQEDFISDKKLNKISMFDLAIGIPLPISFSV